MDKGLISPGKYRVWGLSGMSGLMVLDDICAVFCRLNVTDIF